MPAKINLFEMACCVQQQPCSGIAVFFFFSALSLLLFVGFGCVSLSTKSPSLRLPHCIFSFKLNYIKIKLEFVVVISVFHATLCADSIGQRPERPRQTLQSYSCLLLMFSKIFCKNIKYNMISFVAGLFFGSFQMIQCVSAWLSRNKFIAKLRQKRRTHIFRTRAKECGLKPNKHTKALNIFRQLQILSF